MPEILSVAGRQTGRFIIQNHPAGGPVELHLHDNHLLSMWVQEVLLTDVLAVQGWMIALLKKTAGDFEFTKTGHSDLVENYQIPLDQLFLSSLSAIDEITAFQDHLPNRFTYFKLARDPNEVALDMEESAFIQGNQVDLTRGTNADTIRLNSGMDLEQVLLMLFKLRSAGLLRPMRAVKDTLPAQRQVTPSQSEPHTAETGWDLSGVRVAGASKMGILQRFGEFLSACMKGT